MRGIERRIEKLEVKLGLQTIITPDIEIIFGAGNGEAASVLILGPDGEQEWKKGDSGIEGRT